MRTQNDAAIAAALAAWPTGHTYKTGEVPATPATPYNVVSIDAGTPANYRHASRSTSRTWRIVVQSVGATFNEAAFAIEKADAAFLDKRVAGGTPARREITGTVQRDPDGGGLMYALNTYLYTTPA